MNSTNHNFDSVRRRVQLALAVALLVSVASNVAAAEPTVGGRLVAGWPPVALFLTVDVVGRVPRSNDWLSHVASTATGIVALVAAVASFSHMRHVALMFGESGLVAVLFPLTVDGLAVVCSIGLVKLTRHTTTNKPVSSVSDVSSSVSSAQPPAASGGRVVVRSPQSSTVRPLTPVLTK